MSRPAASLALVLTAAFFCLAPPAGASGDRQSMQDFLKKETGCREFTDQCSICRRDGETVTCSTPSTACIKKDYVCTRKSDD
ncbi:hypothetical protein [Rhizobium sp. CAU 1783]